MNILNLGTRQHLIYKDDTYSFHNETVELLDANTGFHILDPTERERVLHDKTISALPGLPQNQEYQKYLDSIHVRRNLTEASVSAELLLTAALRVLYPTQPNNPISEALRTTDIVKTITDGSADPVETLYQGFRMVYSPCGNDEKSVVFQASSDAYRVTAVDNSWYYCPSKFTLRIARTYLSRIPDFVYANSGANTVVKELMSLISSGRHKRQNVPVTS